VSQPLALPVAIADIVAAGDAENRPSRLFASRMADLLSDHHHQFAFKMGVKRVRRYHDRVARVLQRRNRLVKNLRIIRYFPLAQMTFIVQPDGHDLGRNAGRQKFHIAHAQAASGWLDFIEQSTPKFVNFIAFDGAVCRPAVALKTRECRHVSLQYKGTAARGPKIT